MKTTQAQIRQLIIIHHIHVLSPTGLLEYMNVETKEIIQPIFLNYLKGNHILIVFKKKKRRKKKSI